ncbi:MAG: lytic transglycosylase domain-containing protein, partial [Rhodobacteraceae bacterium]|nr:lytic transglycosylase domain-containing protein [Paracoccaceae bacterium]
MRITARGWGRAVLALALGAGAAAATTPAAAASAPAAPDPAALCEEAARVAAPEAGVPVEVLLAVMLSESGRARGGRLRPWPWTVNAAGRGHYFPDRAAAEAFAAARLAEGALVFDAGCAQVNYRWHGHAFPDAAAMFEPLANARYAAGFLARLHAEFGTWPAAAGAYHSRTPTLA